LDTSNQIKKHINKFMVIQSMHNDENQVKIQIN